MPRPRRDKTAAPAEPASVLGVPVVTSDAAPAETVHVVGLGDVQRPMSVIFLDADGNEAPLSLPSQVVDGEAHIVRDDGIGNARHAPPAPTDFVMDTEAPAAWFVPDAPAMTADVVAEGPVVPADKPSPDVVLMGWPAKRAMFEEEAPLTEPEFVALVERFDAVAEGPPTRTLFDEEAPSTPFVLTEAESRVMARRVEDAEDGTRLAHTAMADLEERLEERTKERDDALAILADIASVLAAAGVEVSAMMQDYPGHITEMAFQLEQARASDAMGDERIAELQMELNRLRSLLASNGVMVNEPAPVAPTRTLPMRGPAYWRGDRLLRQDGTVIARIEVGVRDSLGRTTGYVAEAIAGDVRFSSPSGSEDAVRKWCVAFAAERGYTVAE